VVVSFPIDQSATRKATDVDAWEQLTMVAMMQREYSDAAVSNTCYFDPKTESDKLEHMLAQFAPVLKSVSMLPHVPQGVYEQSPYTGATEEEIAEMTAAITPIDWSSYTEPKTASVIADTDVMPNSLKFCDGASCTAGPAVKIV